MNITWVYYGFITGNLNLPDDHGAERAVLREYVSLVEERLRVEFPGAQVETGYEHGARGEVPRRLQPRYGAGPHGTPGTSPEVLQRIRAVGAAVARERGLQLLTPLLTP